MTFNTFLNLIEFYTGNKNWFSNSKLSLNQKEIVDLIHTSKYSVIYKSRQDGVSTVLSLYLLWRMVETPGITIGLLSHPGAREIFRQNVNWNLSNLKLGYKTHNVDRTILTNGSQIFYLSGQYPNALRGLSLDIIVLDDLLDEERDGFLVDSILTTASRECGKIIISTSGNAIKDDVNLRFDSNINFQEIYGHFFNGKRQVLIEKFKEHKKS